MKRVMGQTSLFLLYSLDCVYHSFELHQTTEKGLQIQKRSIFGLLKKSIDIDSDRFLWLTSKVI